MSGLPVYPGARHDGLSELLSILDPFYVEDYGGSEQVVDCLRAFVQANRRVERRAADWYDAHNRHACPDAFGAEWWPVVLRESDAVPVDYATIGSGTLGSGTIGLPVSAAASFPAPGVRSAGAALDNPVHPTVVLAAGTGFRVDGEAGTITFEVNPFSGGWPVVTDDAGDRTVRVHLYGVRSSAGPIGPYAAIWGVPAGVATDPDGNGRTLADVVWDCAVEGTTAMALSAAVEAATGAVVAARAGTVTAVHANPAGGTIVEIDDACYLVRPPAVATVAAGEAVAAGQFLSDAARRYDVRAGQVPAGLTSVAVPASLLGTGSGPLTFSASTTPLVVETGVSGYTKVSWALGGDSGDAAAFFAELHARGVAAGRTMANYLDRRARPEGQPTANDLPTSVSPLGLLFANVWRHAVTVLALKPSAFAAGAPGLVALRSALGRVADPHRLVLIVEV